MKTVIVIPARYGSSRLPGKPLEDIHGKPMVQHVYERASLVQGVEAVVVATDDVRIVEAVEAFGGQAVLTSADHPSGTDRLVEVMQQIPADVYLNVQGDEPLIRSADLSELVKLMQHGDIPVATLCHPIDATESLNPNCVKVVLDNSGQALYFSRSPIPYPREAELASYLKHVGVYAYRRDVLEGYSELSPSILEAAEVLEQLRLMSAGIKLHVLQVEPTGPGVDTPECLARVRAIMAGNSLAAVPATLSTVLL